MKRGNFPSNKERKRKEAKERNEKWANLTPEQQLAHLDSLGLVATKQRAKIAKRLK